MYFASSRRLYAEYGHKSWHNSKSARNATNTTDVAMYMSYPTGNRNAKISQ